MAGRIHTDEEIAQRHKEIRAVMAAGLWSMSAAALIADKHGVSVQQVAEKDRRVVLQEIRDGMSPEERENSAALWMMQVEDLYAACRAKGDRANAAKALALKAKALGMDAPVRVQHSGPDGGPIAFNAHFSATDFEAGIAKLESEG